MPTEDGPAEADGEADEDEEAPADAEGETVVLEKPVLPELAELLELGSGVAVDESADGEPETPKPQLVRARAETASVAPSRARDREEGARDELGKRMSVLLTWCLGSYTLPTQQTVSEFTIHRAGGGRNVGATSEQAVMANQLYISAVY